MWSSRCSIALTLAMLLTSRPVLAQTPAGTTTADVAAGQKLFVSQCALCHGIDGAGGSGPSLRQPTLRHAADEAELARLVLAGIPGTAMPSFVYRLSDAMASQVAAYVRTLGRVPPERLAGDVARGEATFRARRCESCHVVKGSGRALGPELSEIGLTRGSAYLRRALVDPAAEVPSGHVTVKAVAADGLATRGVRISEDVFWIHLRDTGGRLHSFYKPDLKELVRETGASLMPSYATLLTSVELDDVVAFLASLRGAR